MGYTVTTDRATGYVVTATDWNILEDNSTFLYGDAAWTAVTVFTNSWVTFSGSTTPGYMLMGRTVFLHGLMKTGTIGLAAFTLPVGYRPSTQLNIAVPSNSLFGQLQINTTGVVTPAVGSNVSFAIDCCFSVV